MTAPAQDLSDAPSFADTDDANLWDKLNAIILYFVAWLLAFVTPTAVRQQGRTTANTLTVFANSQFGVSSYDGGTLINKGDIAYGVGVFTVGTAGAYRWEATVTWGSGAGRVSTYVVVNSSAASYNRGRNDQDLDASSPSTTTTGGLIDLQAGDTVQAYLYYVGSGSIACNPSAFSLERRA